MRNDWRYGSGKELTGGRRSYLQRRFGLSSVQVLRASHNCACVQRKFLLAMVVRVPGLVSPSASAFSMRRALDPRRSETQLDSLIWHYSKRLLSWFCSRTCSRLSWFFRRVTVPHRRCSASGTKLRISLLATGRLPEVRHPGNLSYARGVRDSIALAPDAMCPTSGPQLFVLGRSVSGTVPVLPTRASNIAPWIRSRFPRPAALCSINHSDSKRTCSGFPGGERRAYCEFLKLYV
jgi:hypothetical protein